MNWEHYLFGENLSSPTAPTAAFVEQLLDKAEAKCQSLQNLSSDTIISILAAAGRLWKDPQYAPRRLALAHMPQVVGFSPQMTELGLEELSRLLEPESLRTILKGELGSLSSMDSWVASPAMQGLQQCRPLGTLLHVSPGNVFLGAADSLIRGLLTKNVNLLKISQSDTLFPLLFAKSLDQADPQHLIAHSFAAISFKGGDKAVEAVFKKRCNGIVVWGGQKAVEAWRQGLGSGTRLIEYGPRLSLALITQKHLQQHSQPAAEKLATDIVMWEQRGCGSPQVLFLENSDGAINQTIPNFLLSLQRALSKQAEQLPPAELSLDEKIEIRRERELAKFGELTGQSTLYEAAPPLKAQSWTIIVRHHLERLNSPLNRTIIVYPYNHFNKVITALQPYRALLQSCGLGAEPEEARLIADSLCQAGLERICELGQMHLSRHGAPHDGSFQLEHLVRRTAVESMDLVPTTPAMPLIAQNDLPAQEEIKTTPLEERLFNLVEFSRSHSAYYREKTAHLPLHNLTDFAKFPFLSGEELRTATPPVSNALPALPMRDAYIFASGGSTGAPKFSFYTREEWDDVTSILAFIYKTAGLDTSDVVANLFMAGNLYTSFLAASGAIEKIGCVNLPIAGNALIDQVILYCELFKPTAIVGLPSIIIQVAETIERRGLAIRIKKILYGGERLAPEAQQYLRQALGTEIIMSAGYASVDAATVGYQCPHCQGTAHHLLADYQYLEIIDPQTNLPVKAGETGELTVTCLKRRLMPLIRYRTGDLGRLLPGRCACGSSAPLFELLGRAGGFLRVGTVNIYPESIAKSLGSLEGVSHLFQIIANSVGTKDTLLIRVESPDNSECNLKNTIREAIVRDNYELVEALREGWLDSINVELVPPNGLPRIARTGKIKQLVDMRIH